METAVVSQLIDQYGMDVMRFCRSLTRCACDAEDLYQQTFLKLLQLRVKVEREQNPRACLFSIASGIWKNECRKWGRRTDIAPSSSLEELLEQPPQEPPDGATCSSRCWTGCAGRSLRGRCSDWRKNTARRSS